MPAMVTFKPLALNDLPLLHEWLRRPHVAQWWLEPPSLIELEQDYLQHDAGESSTRAYIAIVDGAPIGFI